ncbi:MAG: ATP-binding protein [Planctomycetota bacterium]|jgi:PAS domain S-box-containing protein
MSSDPKSKADPRQPGKGNGTPKPYEQYFEEMPCYLSVHDKDFHIIAGNRRFREDFGDRIGDLCYRAYKQREESCPDCPVERTFDHGHAHGSEQLLTTRDGRQVEVMVHTTPIRDENGEISAVMEMHTEIGELKRIKSLLERSRGLLARLFEEVPCFISVQGPDLIIKHANSLFRETFGPSVGEYCYKTYKHREEPCLVCPTLQTFVDGESREHEEVVTSQSGEKMYVLCQTKPLLDAEGKPEAVIEMATDITKVRELQSQLSSIGLLVGSISHSIKGLLTGLDGGIYLVNTGFDKDKPARVKKGWDMVVRNVERIRSMVMDILYYAKDRELTVDDVDPAVFQEVSADLRKRATDVDVELTVDIPRNVGTFPGDAMAVRAMLLNLLENSLDACRVDKSNRAGKVTLAVRRVPPFMEFEVTDNGIGMDQETRERIFSLFFSSKGIKGTGLGLFISNKIADKHGGTIEVESEPGVGTRFLVRLPLQARPSVPLAQA